MTAKKKTKTVTLTVSLLKSGKAIRMRGPDCDQVLEFDTQKDAQAAMRRALMGAMDLIADGRATRFDVEGSGDGKETD
jgi:hypothetical protein